MLKKRVLRVRRELDRQGLDGILISLPVNRRYLSGFVPDDGQFGESSGSLLITHTDAILLTDFRYEASARSQATYFATRIYRKGLAPELAGLAAEIGIQKLGFEAEGLLVAQRSRLEEALRGVELVPTLGLVARQRIIKHPREVADLEASLGIMEKVLAEVLDSELTGKSEREVAWQIISGLEAAGAEGPAFPPIVASGPNGAEPHAEPGDRIIQEGDPVIFDVGAMYNGYRSDISRTVCAGGLGHLDERFIAVYAAVRAAQLKAMAEIRPGMTGGEADAIARRVIDEAGFKGKFGHSLGHGVGMATHEGPSVGPGSSDVLEPGMVFTIEPGVYLAGVGGVRLEEMVEMTPEGCRRLNRLDYFYELP